jgi:iron(III) transport system substrate-binding protein
MPGRLAGAVMVVVVAGTLAASTRPVGAQGGLNVYCSVQLEWCQAIANEFARQSGIKVAITQKGSGEVFAQIKAEAANPRADVWFGGTGDPHLQAAEEGLTAVYKSPTSASSTPGPSGKPSSPATARSASTRARSGSATTPSCSRRRA